MVALNGYGFSRPFWLAWIESVSGSGFSRRIRAVVLKKKILGAVRCVILDHIYNSVRSLAFRVLDGRWQRWHAARTDSDGNPNVFNLERNEDGLWLNDYWAEPDRTWNPDNEFAFRFRNCFLFRDLIGCGFSFPDFPHSSSNRRTSCRPLRASMQRLRTVDS